MAEGAPPSEPHAESAPRRTRASRRGWEVAAGALAVPLIVVLFARAAALFSDPTQRDRNRLAAIAETERLVYALDELFAETHRYPDPDKGLAVLAPKWIDHVPPDPWGNAYVYRSHDLGVLVDVLSYGADGRPGGRGAAADVSGRFGSLGAPPSTLVHRLAKLLFLAVLLTGSFGARRWRWAAGLLAGAGILAALFVLAMMRSLLELSPPNLLTSMLALGSLTASIALLSGTRGARALTTLAIIAIYLLLEGLIAR